MNFVKSHKIELIIFSIAIIYRLIISGGLIYLSEDSNINFPTVGRDSNKYLELATNINNGSYYLENEREMWTRRPPGYPAFLAGITRIFGINTGIYVASILQIILAGLSAILIFKMSKVWFSEKIGVAASVLFSIEPNSAYFSTILLSDALFVFLFISSIYLLTKNRPENESLFLSGILLGTSALTRSIAQYFIPIAVLYIIFSRKKNLETLKFAIIFFVGAIIIITPWMIRNYHSAGSFDISSDGIATHFKYTIPLFVSYAENKPLNEVKNPMFKRIYSEVEKTGKPPVSLMKKEIIMAVKERPITYGIYHIVKTSPFFLSDGIREILQKIGFIKEKQPNISLMLIKFEFKKIINILFSKFYFMLLIVGALFWTIINILMVYGFLHIYRRKKDFRAIAILLMFTIMYFAFLAGPSVTTRHRMPALAWIFIFAALGIECFVANKRVIWHSFKNKPAIKK